MNGTLNINNIDEQFILPTEDLSDFLNQHLVDEKIPPVNNKALNFTEKEKDFQNQSDSSE